MTLQELEQIEQRAQRRLPIAPEHILTLTAYLRDVLQAKANAEAVASEAVRRAGMKSRYNTDGIRRTSSAASHSTVHAPNSAFDVKSDI